MNLDDCKYKLKKGLKQEKDYIIINQHLWEWFSLNYNGGPELKLLSDKAYIPSSLAPIKENNELNHNEKMHDETKNNNNNQINKNLKKNNKDENVSKLKKKEKLNKFENDKNKLEFEKIFNEKEFDSQPSFSESEGINENNKSASLDSSSNKINSINRYTFNTKFCDFNNSKNNKNENFENEEFFSKIMSN